MKNDIYLIICLIILVIGIIGIFYSNDIADKFKTIKKKSNFVRVSKAVGLIMATIALTIIYILKR